MRSEQFKIANNIKEYIVRIDNYLVNFPKKEIELKSKIMNTSYDLLHKAYIANVSTNKELKKALAEEMVADIKYLNFLLDLCYDKQIINAKKYVKFGEALDDIIRYIISWLGTFK